MMGSIQSKSAMFIAMTQKSRLFRLKQTLRIWTHLICELLCGAHLFQVPLRYTSKEFLKDQKLLTIIEFFFSFRLERVVYSVRKQLLMYENRDTKRNTVKIKRGRGGKIKIDPALHVILLFPVSPR